MPSILAERQGSILRLTLNRPDVRNAFDREMIASLTAAASGAAEDPTLRGIVLTGAGKAFCGGADLAWMSKAIASSHRDNLSDAEDLARMLERLDTLPLPVIGRLHGAAVGGGVGLAAICDIVIAAGDTVFALSEVKLGIIPAVISPYVISKIGISAARELFLTGSRFTAARAREIGLVHEVVPSAELNAAVDRRLSDVLAAGPRAIAAAKAVIREVAGRSPNDVIGSTTNSIAVQRVSAEGQEGMLAFLEAEAGLDPMRFQRLLIANRGEIAIRIIRACREMNIESVAVYSDADEQAPHVRAADRAVRIGPATPAESYLSIPAIIEAARSSGSEAVHPGYGFLSENASFARACERAGLVFVGPPADAIERMGSKIAARELMLAARVPVVPGVTPADQSDVGIIAAAREVGYPALVKASAGGGGKGMRVLADDESASELIQAARREASAAFGDGTLYVERLIERPRHVEIQVFGDAHGGVVHLFERECSVQRRHQKVIEESPSPALTPGLRQAMGEAAVAAARAAQYRNAGTIEFLLEGTGDAARFYFLEMNTRLQVEHPVTEAVAGVDLVRAQLTVAAGEPLPWTQAALSQRGHAIECRVYAEDPDNAFLPQAGPLLLYREPRGPGIRIDSGVVEGGTVSVSYDPLLAKLTVSAESRDAAVARALAALRSFPVLGIRTNIPFLIRVLDHPEFRAGRLDTGFIDRHLAELIGPRNAPAEAVAAAAVASVSPARPSPDNGCPTVADPWTALGEWGR